MGVCAMVNLHQRLTHRPLSLPVGPFPVLCIDARARSFARMASGRREARESAGWVVCRCARVFVWARLNSQERPIGMRELSLSAVASLAWWCVSRRGK